MFKKQHFENRIFRINHSCTKWQSLSHLYVQLMTPKMTLNTNISKVLHIHITTTPPPRVPNFTPPVHSTGSSFRVTGHFERSAPNDPQMTLNTKKLTVLYINVIRTPESQILGMTEGPFTFGRRALHRVNDPSVIPMDKQRPVWPTGMCRVLKINIQTLLQRPRSRELAGSG